MTMDDGLEAHDAASIAERLSDLARDLLGDVNRARPFLRDWPIVDATRPWSQRHLRALHGVVGRHVAVVDDDRSTTEDIEAMTAAIRDGQVAEAVNAAARARAPLP